jgi:hypothetical protein
VSELTDGVTMWVRFPQRVAEEINELRRASTGRIPTISEQVRDLVDLGLAAKARAKRRGAKMAEEPAE